MKHLLLTCNLRSGLKSFIHRLSLDTIRSRMTFVKNSFGESVLDQLFNWVKYSILILRSRHIIELMKIFSNMQALFLILDIMLFPI
jgi:hypothetical protein